MPCPYPQPPVPVTCQALTPLLLRTLQHRAPQASSCTTPPNGAHPTHHGVALPFRGLWRRFFTQRCPGTARAWPCYASLPQVPLCRHQSAPVGLKISRGGHRHSLCRARAVPAKHRGEASCAAVGRRGGGGRGPCLGPCSLWRSSHPGRIVTEGTGHHSANADLPCIRGHAMVWVHTGQALQAGHWCGHHLLVCRVDRPYPGWAEPAALSCLLLLLPVRPWKSSMCRQVEAAARRAQPGQHLPQMPRTVLSARGRVGAAGVARGCHRVS